MSMLDWAKKEIELASKGEDVCGYDIECYKSAFKAFKSLCEDEHSELSIRFTQATLNKLIDGRPLTPINESDFNEQGQCTRMSSLFRNDDGTYNDIKRVTVHDCVTDTYWYNGRASQIVNERFPITMPYMPDGKGYVVHVSEYFIDENGNDVSQEHRGRYNKVVYHYIETPSGEKIELGFSEEC